MPPSHDEPVGLGLAEQERPEVAGRGEARFGVHAEAATLVDGFGPMAEADRRPRGQSDEPDQPERGEDERGLVRAGGGQRRALLDRPRQAWVGEMRGQMA